jgi:hypothetical protein
MSEGTMENGAGGFAGGAKQTGASLAPSSAGAIVNKGAAPAATAGTLATSEAIAPAPTAAAAGAADWRSSLPDEVKPLALAKGWKSPAEALKSYAHLERLVGADRIALPPKDAKGNRDWSQWEGWAALGRPEAPERYAFKASAGPDGAPREASAVDREFQLHMAPLLHRAGLAQWQVDLLAGGMDGFSQRFRGRAEALAREELSAAEAELRRDWDQSFDRHLDLANRAVRQYGGPELARALAQSGLGRNPAVVRAFARIGATLAEDSGLPHDRPGAAGSGGGSARQEIQRLKADAEFQQAFLNRLHPGHEAAMARMLRLQTQASSERSMIDGGAR